MIREEVIKLIQDSDLDNATKKFWIVRVTKEGFTQDVLDGLKEAFQKEIDASFKRFGIEIEDTPEYKQREAEMMKEMEAAKAQFLIDMADIDKQITAFQIQTSHEIDVMEMEALKKQFA